MARIVLAASASVALYKACDLASKLCQSGHAVRAVLTSKAARLIAPQLFEAVTGEPAYSDEFDASRRTSMDHIELARWGECFVAAPCSADLAARLALGLGDDLVTTVALAFPSDRPRLVCPAMNPIMLASAPLRRNLEVLRGDGWEILDPDSGHMACGDEGAGRLPDPQRIAAWIASRLSR
jgi:phosphopantothenoylcysteine decarboxylase/phosphopantothenate--cysteine ligase